MKIKVVIKNGGEGKWDKKTEGDERLKIIKQKEEIKMKCFITKAVFIITLFASPAFAIETPIGEPQEKNGMEIAAVYLQPIEMEPKAGPHAMLAREKSDVHIEADIHALKQNKNGFGAGEWIPYLTITYTLVNLDNNKKQEGMFMPMVATDGPHYGANIKMMGVGNYKLILHIEPPVKQGFGRHTDKETGVGEWWQAFDLEWKFKYIGAGKKGGY